MVTPDPLVPASERGSLLLLDGVRVLDLSQALAGPYCTMLLGDLGADVIKVEPPGGDQSRSWGPPFIAGESSYFLSVNRNKRSAVLDLKSDQGRATAEDLAMAADVVVENFKPGTMERLGLGAKRLRERKPELIYASISGFGQNRPSLAGYDQIAQGTAGMMFMNAPPGQPPAKVGVPIADITAGMFAAHTILAALVERARTGAGRVVDVALNDAVLALFTYQAGRLFATDELPTRDGNFHATISPYGTFRVKDGFINLAVATDSLFERFAEAIGAPELSRDARFTTNALRQANRGDLVQKIESHLARATRDDWLVKLERFGIPAGPILDLKEAFDSPLALDRDMKLQVEHPSAGPITQTGAPWKIDGESSPIRRPPPRLGEHTAEAIAQWLS